jgi:CheY-like chemotaxis protein
MGDFFPLLTGIDPITLPPAQIYVAEGEMNKPSCILVAEDDENDVFFLQQAFKEAEINEPLQVVVDGQEAIEYLSGEGKFADRDAYPVPLLFISDIKMPQKTGLEVLKWIREEQKVQLMPVILYTSSAQPADIAEAGRLSANGYVVKPASRQKRVELARSIKTFWLEFNELSAPRLEFK